MLTRHPVVVVLSMQEHFAINHASKDLSTEFVSFYNSLMLVSSKSCDYLSSSVVEQSCDGYVTVIVFTM